MDSLAVSAARLPAAPDQARACLVGRTDQANRAIAVSADPLALRGPGRPRRDL